MLASSTLPSRSICCACTPRGSKRADFMTGSNRAGMMHLLLHFLFALLGLFTIMVIPLGPQNRQCSEFFHGDVIQSHIEALAQREIELNGAVEQGLLAGSGQAVIQISGGTYLAWHAHITLRPTSRTGRLAGHANVGGREDDLAFAAAHLARIHARRG